MEFAGWRRHPGFNEKLRSQPASDTTHGSYRESVGGHVAEIIVKYRVPLRCIVRDRHHMRNKLRPQKLDMYEHVMGHLTSHRALAAIQFPTPGKDRLAHRFIVDLPMPAIH